MFLYEVLKALVYLDGHGLIHKDVKESCPFFKFCMFTLLLTIQARCILVLKVFEKCFSTLSRLSALT